MRRQFTSHGYSLLSTWSSVQFLGTAATFQREQSGKKTSLAEHWVHVKKSKVVKNKFRALHYGCHSMCHSRTQNQIKRHRSSSNNPCLRHFPQLTWALLRGASAGSSCQFQIRGNRQQTWVSLPWGAQPYLCRAQGNPIWHENKTTEFLRADHYFTAQ